MPGFRTFPVLALLLCSACGGGGESAPPAAPAPAAPSPAPPVTPPVVPPPATPSTVVTFTATSVSFAGNNTASRATTLDESIGINVANPPAAGLAGLWTKATATGVPVADASVRWLSASEGKVRLLIRSPSTLGAGTYRSTVTVEICLDATCTQPAPGSPTSIEVTYVVTGGASPSTQVHWSESFLTDAVLTTSEVRSPRMTLRISTSDLGLWRPVSAAHRVGHRADRTREVQPTQLQFAGGRGFCPVRRRDLKPPASLGSGFFTDTMHFEGCFDAACTSIVPGSRYTLSFDLLISATEGTEFTRRSLAPNMGAREVVWSPANQSLYVVAGLVDPQILQVNPLTMASTTSSALGVANPPQHLAVSQDGSYLYMGSKTQPTILRLQLPAMTQDLSIPLGNFNSSSPYVVNDLAMVPGQPQTFVVARAWSIYHGGILVYDNAVARAAAIAPDPGQVFEYARWLVPAAAPGTFISMRYGPSQPVVNTLSDQLLLDAGGISTGSSLAFTPVGLARYWTKPKRAGAKLYMGDGTILDAATGTLLGSLPSTGDSTIPYAVLPDEANARILVWKQVRQREFILSYDITTLKLLGLAEVHGAPTETGGSGRGITLWGSDGVALTAGSQLVVLSGAFFSTYRGEPTMNAPTPIS